VSAFIIGCSAAVILFCMIYPPAAWPIAAVIGTVVAFAGDSRG
jgi:hypothetical protein